MRLGVLAIAIVFHVSKNMLGSNWSNRVTAAVGKADRVISVAASACHGSWQEGVSPGPKATPR